MSEVKVDSIGPRVDSGTLTIGASGDTITIPSGATFTQSGTMNASAITAGTMATARLGSGTASSSTFLRGDQTYAAAGEINQPIWFGRKGDAADQTLTRATKTLITGMTADEIDTNGAYSSSRFTVPSGHAGKYFIHGSLVADFTGVGSNGEETYSYIYKNGVETLISGFTFDPGGKFHTIAQNVSGIINLAEGDYVELYGKLTDDDGGQNAQVSGGKGTNFGGFKISS